MSIVAQYKAAPEFTSLAQSTKRAYLAYIKLIEDEFGDLPIAALTDRRVRGEFKSWRDKFANTPRKADYAWTTLARVMSFAKDRGIIATNPCERGGRLYVADRKDKIWTEQDIAAVLSVASTEIQLPSFWLCGAGNDRATCCACLGPPTTARTSAFANPRAVGAWRCRLVRRCGFSSTPRSVVDR